MHLCKFTVFLIELSELYLSDTFIQIAQVHRATLLNGQEVVVKVQHDGIKTVILEVCFLFFRWMDKEVKWSLSEGFCAYIFLFRT